MIISIPLTRWSRPLLALIAAGLSLALSAAQAIELPARAELQQRLGREPATVRVVEPHLSTAQKPQRLSYRGWPATQVLDALFGPEWKDPRVDIEFRALDGYVSRIPSERFRRHRAWLVFERTDQPEFSVHNLAQNEKNVPLGPYYLVWDNIRSPELLAQGAANWPYQVAQVLLSTQRTAALLPAGMAPRFQRHAAEAQAHCLTCHQVNGYGGDKWPINLAVSARGMDAEAFRRWVLQPSEVKPGTTMPGLPDTLAAAEREAMARRLYTYLRALPVQP